MAGKAALKLLSKGIVPMTAGGAFLTSEDAEATFGGILAKGTREIIADAARMEARGLDRDDIWRASFDKHSRGAFKGDDGLWRVEFNDYIDQLKYPDGYQHLNQILGDNEVNSAYNFSNTFVSPHGASNSGQFDPTNKAMPRITIPRMDRMPPEEDLLEHGFSKSEVDFAKVEDQYARAQNGRILLHESQHNIQNIEGFTPGSSPKAMGGYDNYKRVSGEIEARNVADRANMTPGDKHDMPPWWTEDISENDTRFILKGEDQRRALKRQAAFLASIGLSAGAIADGEMPTIDDPEVQGFVEKARSQGFSDTQISAYLSEQATLQSEGEPLAARAEPLTDEEYEEALSIASPQQIAQYEAEVNKRTINYDSLTKNDFAKPHQKFQEESEVPTADGGIQFANLSEEEVRDIAAELRVDPRTKAGINAVYAQNKRNKFAGGSKELVSALKEVQHVDRPWLWLKSHFDTDADLEYKRMQKHTTETVVSQLKERGIEAVYDDKNFAYMAKDPNGEWVEVTPGFMEEMGAMKYETVGSIGGGIGGVAAVRAMGPYGKWAQLAGAGAGAIAGAVIGDQVDYLSAAMETQQNFDAQIAAEKALGTANTAVLWEVGLLGVGHVGKTGWNWIRQAYRNAKDGNTRGAYEALKKGVGYASDDEINEAIARWEKLNERKAPVSKRWISRGTNTAQNEQALAIAPTTMAGGEHIIGASIKIDPEASSAIAAEINKRAQDVLKLASQGASDDSGKQFIKALSDYESEVRTTFSIVKDQGADIVPNTVRFDFNATAIKPLIEGKMASMDAKAKLDTLHRVLSKIENVTKTRAFPDLLDLRRTLNDFKFNRKITQYNDYVTINEAIGNIDSQVNDAMKQSPEGRQWLKDWKDANADYSKYAQVRNTALWKATIKKTKDKKGPGEDDIARALIKYGKSIDSTFEEVMEKLPIKTRGAVESSIVEQLTNKFTVGKEGEFRATYFPELAKALRPYDLKTADAARMKKAVERMAEVYQNDVKLAATAGKITIPGFQSYLTDDPFMRLKMHSISVAFNYMRRLIPGGKSDNIAMAMKVADLLENPLNTKTVDQVMKTIQEEEGLSAAIKRLQSATAREQAQNGQKYKVKLYKDSSGKVYTTPGKYRTASSEELPIHRIVPEDMAKEMLQIDKITSSTLTRSNRLKLVDAGFLKVKLADGQLINLEL